MNLIRDPHHKVQAIQNKSDILAPKSLPPLDLEEYFIAIISFLLEAASLNKLTLAYPYCHAIPRDGPYAT